MEIPRSYTTAKFRQYCGKVTQNARYLNGGCPICREGKSWGKKRRLYYFLQDEYLYCQNCSTSWTPCFWLKAVTGMTWTELVKDVEEYTGDEIDHQFIDLSSNKEWIPDVPSLPGECVNIGDANQLRYYIDNWVVQKAITYIRSRRLDTALYSPKTYYVCVNDKFHKNRLVIPYFNEYGRIESYISRTFLENDTRRKYNLKFNSPKAVFNLDKLDNSYPNIFVIEGPIDTMFVQNGIGISGVSMTEKQATDVSAIHPFHEKIWVFDNYRTEGDEVRNKIIEKVKEGERVFLYDGPFMEHKDLNDYCVKKGLDFVDPDLILKYSYSGEKCLLRL